MKKFEPTKNTAWSGAGRARDESVPEEIAFAGCSIWEQQGRPAGRKVEATEAQFRPTRDLESCQG